MSNQKQKKDLYYVHTAIGLAITALFWIMPHRHRFGYYSSVLDHATD